jgi:transcriptional regulator with XRE-family HTH domain
MNKNPLFSSSLGDQLRARRKSSNLTQAELASRIGCSLPTVGQAERGEGRVDTFEHLAAAMDIEITGRSLPPGETLGARLALLRQRRGISCRSLAALSQISAPTIAALEGGALGHLVSVQRVAVALGAGLCLVPRSESRVLGVRGDELCPSSVDDAAGLA